MTSHAFARALLAAPDFELGVTVNLGPAKPKASPRPNTAQDGASPNPKRCPTKPFSLWVAKLYNRRPTTEWSDDELKAYRKLKEPTDEEKAMVERYYAAERKKGDGENGGIHRRDLLRFLRHMPGELDRARAHHEAVQRKLVRFEPKVVAPEGTPEPVMSEEEAREKFRQGVAL